MSGSVIRGSNDPDYVRRQYKNELGLRARKAVYGSVGGPDARDIALAAVREASPARILEVGCGEGEFSARLAAELGDDVVALDQSARMVELARVRGVDARVGDVQELPFADGSFDLVLTSAVILHNPPTIAERIRREVVRVSRHYTAHNEDTDVSYNRFGYDTAAWYAERGIALAECGPMPAEPDSSASQFCVAELWRS